MDKKSYKKYTAKTATPSPIWKDTVLAFVSGGLICILGKLLSELYLYWGISEDSTKILVSVTLIFIACLLTGIGIFDKIAKYAGAGTLVPITGFANATMSPALDSKSEGFVLGVGAKLFTVSGPVILYAVLSGAIYGVIYYICGVM